MSSEERIKKLEEHWMRQQEEIDWCMNQINKMLYPGNYKKEETK